MMSCACHVLASNGGQRFASISFVSDPAAAACMPHGTVCMCVLLEGRTRD